MLRMLNRFRADLGVTVKDNRLLPRGFDKSSASDDIAVRGQAAADADFGAGGNRVSYIVDLPDARGH
jgi:hypothetical protein